MSYSVKGWHALFGAILIAACDASPAGPSFDETEALVASSPAAEAAGRTDRSGPDVEERRGERHHRRLQAAAREAIEYAKALYARAEQLVGPDSRPAVKEALADARQLIDQAIDAYGNGDYNRALIKAQNAADLLLQILRYLG
jgi:HEPN domain-containing protein